MTNRKRPGASASKGRPEPEASVLPEGTLGPLETEVMQAVWATGPVTTRDVHQQIRRRRDIAYTTVMTIMGNLTRKGLLERRLEGRAYLYWATATQEEVTRSQVAKVVGALLARFAEPAMSYLTGKLNTLSEDTLAELEAEVARLRKQRATHPGPAAGQPSSETEKEDR